MTITAIFSTGFSDTYKGDRAVAAAWAIIRKADGAVLKSGHSLDIATASKTAAGNVQSCGSETLGADHELRFVQGPNRHLPAARRRADRAHNAARLTAISDLVTIEVVSL